MIIISSRGVKKINKLQLGLFSVIIIISLSITGLGLAAWQDQVLNVGFISTGNIDLVFTKAVLSGNRLDEVEADIASDGKSISVSVNDVEKNEVIELDYEVLNRGSIPVRFYTQIGGSISGLEIDNRFPNNPFKGYNDGHVMIKAGEDDEPSSHSFNLSLYFRQWN